MVLRSASQCDHSDDQQLASLLSEINRPADASIEPMWT